MPQRNGYLDHKELNLFSGEPLHLNQMPKQLASFDKFHQKINSVFVLEHVLHVDNEWVLDCEQDILLQLDVFILLVVNNNVLPDTFHCINSLSIDVLDEVNLSKCSLAYHFFNFEVF